MANLGLKNNNAGNLRNPKTGNFQVFNDMSQGKEALINDLNIKKSGKSSHIKPGGSILDLANVWAPESDNNKSQDWANNVAKTIGKKPTDSWADIPTDKLAQGIQVAEGTSTPLQKAPSGDLSVAGSNSSQLEQPSQLVQKWKAKYPTQYNDLSDSDLEKMILKKYPQYADLASHSQSSQKGTFDDIINQQKQQDESPVESEKKDSLIGGAVKSLVKSPLTMLARPIQLGAELLGSSAEDVNKVTKSIAGDYVAPVPQNATDVIKDVGRGAETVAEGYGLSKGAGLVKALIGNPALKGAAPFIQASQGISPEVLSTLTRTQQLNVLGETLKGAQMGDAEIITKAIKSLQPGPGFIQTLVKTAGGAAKEYMLIKAFGGSVGGLIHNVTSK